MSQLPALIIAITGLLAAIGTIVGLFRHKNGPRHNRPAAPPRPPRP